MTRTVDQIAAEAMQLPVDARALLVDKLVESLDLTEPGELQRLLAGEAAQRREEIRSGQVTPINAEDVVSDLRRSSRAL